MSRFPANHPLWSIIKLAVMLVALTAILYINASSFDTTEITTIIWWFLVASGVEGLSSVIEKFNSPNHQK